MIATLEQLRTRLFYGWQGAGMLSRLSSASTLLLGGIAIAGMSLVAFLSSQGWPGTLSGPGSSPPQLIRLSSPGEGVRQALGGSRVAMPPAGAPAPGHSLGGATAGGGGAAGGERPAPGAANEIRSGNGPGLQPGAGHPPSGAGQPQPGPGGGPSQPPAGETPGTPSGGGLPGGTPAPAPEPAPAAQGNGNGNGHAYGHYKSRTKAAATAGSSSSSGNGNASGHTKDPSTAAPAEQPASSADQGGGKDKD